MHVPFENVFTHIEVAVAVGEVPQALSNEDFFVVPTFTMTSVFKFS